MDIRKYIKEKKLICDGAFGTYFSSVKKGMIPEMANTKAPDIVYSIHREYIEKGAKLIRTNTFEADRYNLGCTKEELIKNVCAAYDIAKKAAGNDIFVACDMGPSAEEDYFEIADTFIDKGADIILFETLADIEPVLPVIRYIKKKKSNIFIITQFAVNQHGYTEAGLSAQRLFDMCSSVDEIDAMGLNCGVGPAHLLNVIKNININTDKFITAFPNAGYPSVVRNRMVYMDNINYFTDVMKDISNYADIVGGCCGTTPEYIKSVSENVDVIEKFKPHRIIIDEKSEKHKNIKDGSFFAGKEGKKLIAVELDPPKDADCTGLMETANYLKTKDVDVITFADSPSGRTRADSVLMSIKVSRETGMNVMPHICCRDKNTIAISSLILGAYINDIRNFLVITGDPVPGSVRDSVKGVFNFDSVRLMEYMKEMNDVTFTDDKICYGGAINYSRRNIENEIDRINRKIDAGAEFFFTQPVYDKKDIETLRYIKSCVNTKILVGIMPLVSIRNARFIKNEITGISVPDSVVNRFSEDMSREDARKMGVEIAGEVMECVSDFADGYYFMIPFNRLETAKALIERRSQLC